MMTAIRQPGIHQKNPRKSGKFRHYCGTIHPAHASKKHESGCRRHYRYSLGASRHSAGHNPDFYNPYNYISDFYISDFYNYNS
jgi:hypothetical protein